MTANDRAEHGQGRENAVGRAAGPGGRARDEIWIHLAPGVRLFDGVDRERVSLDITGSIHSSYVTHLRYRVKNT